MIRKGFLKRFLAIALSAAMVLPSVTVNASSQDSEYRDETVEESYSESLDDSEEIVMEETDPADELDVAETESQEELAIQQDSKEDENLLSGDGSILDESGITADKDMKVLKAAYEKMDGILSSKRTFTKESLAALEGAMATAKKLLDTAAESKTINAAIDGLLDAWMNLEDGVQVAGLEAAINAAEEALADENAVGNYSQDSIETVETRLYRAYKIYRTEYTDLAEGQTKVNEMTSQLIQSVNELSAAAVEKADLSVLKAAVNMSDSIKADKYTKESYAVLEKALKAAKDLLTQDVTADRQSEVDQAVKVLTDAFNQLESASSVQPVKNADLARLKEMIAKAEKVSAKDYTAESVNVLNRALSVARELVKGNPQAELQNVVNAAASSLESAIGDLVRSLPKKNAKVEIGNYIYQVTSSTSAKKYVTLVKPKKKTLTKAVIPSTVKINGYTFKVTAVGSKAFYKNRKLKSVVVGSNVTTIGKSCFSGCSSLRSIKISSTKLKKVGTSAFKGIYKKAVIKVPKSKLKTYKRILKKKGQSSKAVIKA